MPDMETILENLSQNPSVEGALVVGSRDGLVIAAAGEANPDPDFLAAESMDMYTNAEAGMNEKFQRGGLEMLSLEGANGHMLIRTINPEFYLLVLARSDMNLGMVRLDVRKAGDALREEL